jgi:hypothetical protein
VDDTLPVQHGQRHYKVFELARYLKSQNPAATVDQMAPIVAQWYAKAAHLTSATWEHSWGEFQDAWARAKVGGWGAITTTAPDFDQRPYAGPAGRIWQLCQAAQAHHGPGRPWPLSGRMAGGYAECDQTYASRILNRLVEDGRLKRDSTGTYKNELASTYMVN